MPPMSLSAGVRSSRSADVTLPQIPYVGRMKTSIDELVVFCSVCEHSEFVHTNHDNPLCLFSDCDCTGFGISIDLTATSRRS